MTADGRRLWLVRHGETEGQSSIRYHGANDVPLSDAGRQQIRDLLPVLTGVTFTQVVHSPLSRAAESAAILSNELQLAAELRVDVRLREISFGAAEGMTREEIDEAFPSFWQDYEGGRIDAFPEGESRAAFSARVGDAIDELCAEAWTGDLLVVAHRGIVKHALRRVLRQQDAPMDAFGVELGSLSVAREQADGWQLELLGMRP